MWEGGGSVGMVCGHNSLTLGIVSLLVAVEGLWEPSNVAWGSMALLVACSSLHVSLSSSNLGSLGIPARSPDSTNASHWGCTWCPWVRLHHHRVQECICHILHRVIVFWPPLPLLSPPHLFPLPSCSMYLFLLFSPFSTDPPFLSISCYCTHVDRHITGGHHGHLGLCFIGEHVCGQLEHIGVKFGTGRGIVKWLGVRGGWKHVSRSNNTSICCWHHHGCAKCGLGDFKQDRWGCTEPFDMKMFV